MKQAINTGINTGNVMQTQSNDFPTLSAPESAAWFL